jgi:hypothetical protein
MFSHPIENQWVIGLIYLMFGLGINAVLFFPLTRLYTAKHVTGRQADRVLQSYPHENRAFNPRGHIHDIKVTHCFKRTLPRT